MTDFAKTEKNTVRRSAKRGHYDKETVHAIIDDARICHVGIVEGSTPFVIPQLHVRVDDHVYLHGSRASRLLKYIEAGNEVCITCTRLDGLVLARSAFHHSMNYRSVVLFGKGRSVDDDDEKTRVFDALVDKVMPGRSADARRPDEKEKNATSLTAIPIDMASAKIRTGPPLDDDRDMDLGIWAGVVPIREIATAPEPDPQLPESIPVPDYVSAYVNEFGS